MLLFRSQWVSKERFLFPQECFRKPVVNIPFPRSQTESVFKAKIFQPAALQDGELIRFLLSFFVSQLSFRLSFSTRTSSEPSLFTQTVIWREKKTQMMWIIRMHGREKQTHSEISVGGRLILLRGLSDTELHLLLAGVKKGYQLFWCRMGWRRMNQTRCGLGFWRSWQDFVIFFQLLCTMTCVLCLLRGLMLEEFTVNKSRLSGIAVDFQLFFSPV